MFEWATPGTAAARDNAHRTASFDRLTARRHEAIEVLQQV